MNKPRTYRARHKVEAMLYDGTNIEAICKWANSEDKRKCDDDPWIDYITVNDEVDNVHCNTIYGTELVMPGDYVVWDGLHFFPYRQSRFNAKYQLWEK